MTSTSNSNSTSPRTSTSTSTSPRSHFGSSTCKPNQVSAQSSLCPLVITIAAGSREVLSAAKFSKRAQGGARYTRTGSTVPVRGANGPQSRTSLVISAEETWWGTLLYGLDPISWCVSSATLRASQCRFWNPLIPRTTRHLGRVKQIFQHLSRTLVRT